METKLSINLNKWATLRNARGGDNPNLVETALKAIQFGVDGITVHPRPDQRHITFNDVTEIAKNIQVEFNIEGYPTKSFIDLVLKTKPAQVTLVPDPPNALTSSFGWDTIEYNSLLTDVIMEFKKNNIRTSIFLNPNKNLIPSAAKTGTDRIELYTEMYAKAFKNKTHIEEIKPYIETAIEANLANIGVNAGHDLDLQNLAYFISNVPNVLEVSIGHALICDAIDLGLQNTIQMYKARCKKDFIL